VLLDSLHPAARHVLAVILAGSSLAVGCSGSSGASLGDAGREGASHVGDAGRHDAASGDGSSVCVAGRVVSCACPGTSVTGTQMCLSSGSGFGSCSGCPGGGDASVHDGGRDASDRSDAGRDASQDAATDAGLCVKACETSHAAAYAKFIGYELQECGCANAAACVAECTAECANPTTLTGASPCGQCLITQVDMGSSSTCSLRAELTDCESDAVCRPFLTCVQTCVGPP